MKLWHVFVAVALAWVGLAVLFYYSIQGLAPKVIHFLTANGVKGL